MTTYAIIRAAIQHRRQIVATYDGYVRYMCPHALGSLNGEPRALFFQFAGGSKSGLPPGGEWRCIPLDELTGVSAQDGPWHTDTVHPWNDRKQSCMDTIAVEVP